MSEEKINKLFKWIDLIKIILYVVVAGSVGLAAWATKIQMQINDNRVDIDVFQANVQHSRETRNEQDKVLEHRLSDLETDVNWLKGGKHG